MSSQLTTIVKAMRVLEALGDSGPAGVTELARRLDMDKSIVSRVLSTLKSHSFVRPVASGRYDLGLRVFELGQMLIERLPFRSLVIPHLEALAAETGETACAGVLNRGDVVYVYDAVSAQAIRLGPRAGLRQAPWNDAFGHAILAFHDEGAVLDDLRAARQERVSGLPSAQALRRDLAAIRERGFAMDTGGTDGVAVVAAPVTDRTGRVSAALGIGGPADRLAGPGAGRMAGGVLEHARRVSTELGGIPDRSDQRPRNVTH